MRLNALAAAVATLTAVGVSRFEPPALPDHGPAHRDAAPAAMARPGTSRQRRPAAPPAAGGERVFIRVRYDSEAQLRSAAARFDHMRVDRRTRTLSVDADLDDIRALQAAGMSVSVDVAATRQMREVERVQAATLPTDNTIAGFPCYRTVEETYAAIDTLAKSMPQLARVVDIGPTWLRTRSPSDGFRMQALELGNRATDASIPDKPVMVLFAAIHAREYTTAELSTRFAEWLAYGYGNDDEATWLLDNFRFDLVLLANPDGRKRAEAGQSWRKNVDTDNGTCDPGDYGIDLNRNFPFQWGQTPGGSSSDGCAVNYRGPAPQSEPETQALLRYVAGTPDASGTYVGGVLPDRRGDAPSAAAPDDYRGIFLDIHSYSQRVLWPWAYSSSQAGNGPALRTLGRRLAWFNGYTPQQWIGMYPADGTDTDAMYGLLGVPSYTIELGESFFEGCSTFETSTLPDNIAALRYAARNLQAPYRSPSGPDTTAMSLAPRSVSSGAVVSVSAIVDDSPFNQGNGTEPVQAIASARAYLDQAPWAPGAVGVPMTPGDGSFDSSMEVVSASINTAGLAPGRHVVYIRGTDASGTPGTPRAMYFQVDAPPCTPDKLGQGCSALDTPPPAGVAAATSRRAPARRG